MREISVSFELCCKRSELADGFIYICPSRYLPYEPWDPFKLALDKDFESRWSETMAKTTDGSDNVQRDDHRSKSFVYDDDGRPRWIMKHQSVARPFRLLIGQGDDHRAIAGGSLQHRGGSPDEKGDERTAHQNMDPRSEIEKPDDQRSAITSIKIILDDR